jgi:Mce-associated membrane protein
MEGDAGTSQLNPTDQQDITPPELVADDHSEEPTDESAQLAAEAGDVRRPARIGSGIASAVCLVLVLLAVGAGVGGYLALRSHHESQSLAAHEAAAVAAAKDCITATQAPDTTAMITAQTKIIECSTGAFGAQAPLYSGVILDAYKAADAQVKVAEIRAAAEKHNDDGSIDVLVAVRVKISNSAEKDKEVGYRLRVQMAPVDGTYKVAKLDQVTS